jgi:hypothetical protein
MEEWMRCVFRKLSLVLAIPVLAVATSVSATPVLLYNNGAPNGANGNEMTMWIQAEDFLLAGLTNLTGVRFWAFENG